MQLLIRSDGNIEAIYAEMIDLSQLGRLAIQRASYVEPDRFGQWVADLGPIGGPCLGPFARRSEALTAELGWLEANWLGLTPSF